VKSLRRYTTPLILIGAWQCLSYFEIIPRYKLPSPVAVVFGFKNILLTGIPPGFHLHNHLIYSLYRVSLGYMAAVLIAIPLGIFMGWSTKLREIVDPIVEMIRPIPPLAWIPIAILWFGIGIKSAAFIIFLGVFFPVLLNTISGVCSIDPILIEAARTLDAKTGDIFLKVLIPAAVPSIFVGMRIGVGIGWMTLVAAEFTGVKTGYGLGYMIMVARDLQRPAEILAGMAVIGLVGIFINEGFRWVESVIVKWK
jgi:ABC-type nitrate/sulfonate/bicarbonate transport system permease component